MSKLKVNVKRLLTYLPVINVVYSIFMIICFILILILVPIERKEAYNKGYKAGYEARIVIAEKQFNTEELLI